MTQKITKLLLSRANYLNIIDRNVIVFVNFRKLQ
jgi:hypothetical protein